MGSQLDERIKSYAKANQLKFNLKGKVGFGNDGDVWATSRSTVIKVFYRGESYSREKACFLRLRDRGIKELDGLSVPQLVQYDDSLLIVEMTFVNPPYILDFGKAYLDGQSPYDAAQLDEWRLRLRNSFRTDDLPRVHKILRTLNGLGIGYYDARPWNIRLRNDEQEKALPPDDDWEKDFD
jgi:hypothetical protein